MDDYPKKLLQLTAGVVGFVVTALWALFGAVWILGKVMAWFPPDMGNPSTDPSGRALPNAVDVLHLGPSLTFLLAVIGGWLAYLLADRKNWTVDLFVATPVLLVFAAISLANYADFDMIVTRDAQGILNVALAVCGLVVVISLQRSLRSAKSLILLLSGTIILAFAVWAYVAIPLWYTFSYFSWKLGAGELRFGEAANLGGVLLSVVSVGVVQWRSGVLGRIAKLTSE